MPGQFVDSIINENLKVATEYFKATVSNIEKNPDSGGTIGFIPFKINFTVDGISGIKIYNELNVNTDFLPNGYTKTTKFIVTGVDHKLSNGDWETVINTTLIPNASNIGIITREIVLAKRKSEVIVKKEIILPPDNSSDPIIPYKATPAGYRKQKYGGIRGDLFSWVPGYSWPNPTDPSNYNGTNYPFSKYPDFTEIKRQQLLTFQKSGYILGISNSGELRAINREENWIQKLATNPAEVDPRKPQRGATKYKTLNYTSEEQQKMYKDILAGIGGKVTKYNLLWMKLWRDSEGASASHNPWNSTDGLGALSKYNLKPGVKNYSSYAYGVKATIKTLINGNYPTIIKALQLGLNSWEELVELATLTQKWDMDGFIPAKWKIN